MLKVSKKSTENFIDIIMASFINWYKGTNFR